MNTPVCIGCNKPPDELDEYIELGALEDMTPTEFVCREEGTYNPENGHFLCTTCYIKAGMPSTPIGWVAP